MTPRQRDALVFICGYWDRKGCSPSIQEIADGVDFASKSGAYRVCQALQRDGWISQHSYCARSIEVLKRPPFPKIRGEDKALCAELRARGDKLSKRAALKIEELLLSE